MSLTYPPRRDSDWMTWANTFSAKLNQTPEAYNVSDAQAQEVEVSAAKYTAALAVTDNPSTRTKPTLDDKDDALKALKAVVQATIRQVAAGRQVTNAQRSSLGLKPLVRRKHRVPPPAATPAVSLLMIGPASLKATVRPENDPDRRALPRGVGRVELLYFLGDRPPADVGRWLTRGVFGRTDMTLFFDDRAEPVTVWIRARYLNPRGEIGTASAPAVCRLPGMALVVEGSARATDPQVRDMSPTDEKTPLKIAS